MLEWIRQVYSGVKLKLRQRSKLTDTKWKWRRGLGVNGRKKYHLWQCLLFHFSRQRLCPHGQWREGPLCVSMATAYLSRDGENKGAVRRMQFGLKRSISLLTWVEWQSGYFKKLWAVQVQTERESSEPQTLATSLGHFLTLISNWKGKCCMCIVCCAFSSCNYI